MTLLLLPQSRKVCDVKLPYFPVNFRGGKNEHPRTFSTVEAQLAVDAKCIYSVILIRMTF